MAERYQWLRSFGSIGTFIANALMFLTTNWGVAVTAALALLAGGVAKVQSFFLLRPVQVAIAVFLVGLWTYIGFVVLAERRKPRLVRPAFDYAYGLTFGGIFPGYSAKEGVLQFQIFFHNFSTGPIRYTLEKFNVLLEDRTLPPIKKGHLTGILQRGAGKRSGNVPFKKETLKDFIGRRVEGTLDFEVIYGHPEKPPVRRLKMSHAIVVELNENEPLGFNEAILEESDEPIES